MKIGYQAKLYLGAVPLADVPSTGDWTELAIVKDVTQNDEMGMAEVTTRANGGFVAEAPALRTVGVDVEIAWEPDDEGFEALRAAYAAREEIAVAIMDGDITENGTTGVAGNFTVAKFGRSEPLADHITAALTLRPSSYLADYTVGE